MILSPGEGGWERRQVEAPSSVPEKSATTKVHTPTEARYLARYLRVRSRFVGERQGAEVTCELLPCLRSISAGR